MLTTEIFTKQLSDLIAFQTLPDNREELLSCLSFIQSLIAKEMCTQLIREDVSPILLAGKEITKTPDILFLAHADVVSGKEDQFRAKQRGNVLFGRGASDMKFSIPIGVALLQDHMEAEPDSTYMLGITTDEEVGGFKGAAYLAHEYGLKPKILVVLDGGENFTLVQSSKGILDLNIETTGKPAHPCYPHKGSNPINPLLLAGSELISLFPDSEKKSGQSGSTVYIEKIEGGNSTDRYANHGSLEAVITYPATENQEDVLKQVTDALKARCGERVTVSILATGDPVYTDTTSPEFELFKKTVEKARGKSVRIGIQSGGSDARHFSSSQPIVLMTKPHGGNIHGDREHVSIPSSMLLYHALHQFVREYTPNKESL